MDESEEQHDEKTEGEGRHAEGEAGRKLSEKTPEAASGKGDTPLGDTDQHSDAPGPHGLD